MIRRDKPNETPRVLLNRGNAKTQQNCEAYVEDPAAYDSGELKFTFTNHIYGSPQVREVLKRLQHNKCCYCESETSPGRIDHFRPKGRVRQHKAGDKIYPGYYWLAYRWDNLVFACEDCNRMKSDYFPLKDPEQRARNHLEPLNRESPLLLNPYVDTDSGEHITFFGSACQPRTERGRVTVTLLKLNRPILQEQRQRTLSILECLCAVVRDPNTCETLSHNVRCTVDSFARCEAPYSAMARVYLSAIDVEK